MYAVNTTRDKGNSSTYLCLFVQDLSMQQQDSAFLVPLPHTLLLFQPNQDYDIQTNWNDFPTTSQTKSWVQAKTTCGETAVSGRAMILGFAKGLLSMIDFYQEYQMPLHFWRQRTLLT